MAIYLNVSHSLKNLFSVFSQNISAEHDDVFTPVRVVTQTDGINNWIRYQYAEKEGVAANLQFSKINDLIYKVYRWLHPDAPPALDRSSMVWAIYECLQNPEFTERFPDKAAYVSNDPVKQIALAMQMADLFDQYQVYRHDLISKWNGETDQMVTTNDWQQYLWLALKNKTGDRFLDRPQISVQLRKALINPDNHAVIRQRLPKLHFFGIAIITPYYLELFRLLSSITDICFYLLNPCPEHPWMDTVTEKQIARLRSGGTQTIPNDYLMKGNDLLLHWGRVLKESFYLLVEKDDFVNAYTVIEQPNSVGNPQNLLHKIQSDIYTNAPLEERYSIDKTDVSDQSLVINGCYTQVREVEVLYNFLLQKLSSRQDSDQPGVKDILVLVSDIDLYAPIIHAVFRHGPVYIPYTIADESVVAGNTIFSALKEILEINIETFKSEEILSLLESPFIRSHFGFSDIEAIRDAVREAAIYFGSSMVIDDPERYRQSETWMVGWEYGLKKIIYGLCISGEPEYNDGADILYPLDTAEGADMDQRIRLLHFFMVLRAQLMNRNTNRTLSEWADYLSGLMLEMVIDPDSEDESDYPRFVALIDEWKLLGEENNEKISFEVFRYAFFRHLEEEKRYRKFAGTGITFCSLVPMRSIPHQIVAMLGMNFNEFPRKEQPLSFNVMTEKGSERIGDRNIRENDKHLFLETLLSAEETFYISYIARDKRDGSVLPPSSLVDQLIDYVARGMNQDAGQLRKEWIRIHPLHGFSSKYDGKSYISYLNDQMYHSGVLNSEREALPVSFNFSEISIHQLSAFMENPPKVFLNKSLNIYYKNEEELLSEHELFQTGKLDEWGLKSELFDLLLYGEGFADEEEEKKFLFRLKQAGRIPLAGVGRISYQDIREEVQPFEELFREIAGDRKMTPVDISVSLDGSQINGKIKTFFEDRLIYVCNSSSLLKHITRAWIQYLGIVASGVSAHFYFIYRNKESYKVEELSSDKLSSSEAKDILKKIVADYKVGHTGWFFFHPEFARENLTNIEKDYSSFMGWYEERIESKYEYRLKDVYLTKAVRNGFFEFENYPILQQNVLSFMLPLKELFPSLFE